MGVVAPVVGTVPLERGPAPGPEVRLLRHGHRSSCCRARRPAAARLPHPTRQLLLITSLLYPATRPLQGALLLTGPPILVAGTITVPVAEPGRETTTTTRGLKQVRPLQACCAAVCPHCHSAYGFALKIDLWAKLSTRELA